MRLRLSVLSLALLCWLPSTSLATEAATPLAEASDQAPITPVAWRVAIKGGVSLFTTSHSLAVEHFLHPALRVEGTYDVSERLAIGAEVGATVTGDANYAFEAASVVLRTPLYRGSVFSLILGWGFGIGTGPPILSGDLRVSAAVVPTMQLSLGAMWALVPERVYLGVEFIDEQLTVLTGVLSVGLSL